MNDLLAVGWIHCEASALVDRTSLEVIVVWFQVKCSKAGEARETFVSRRREDYDTTVITHTSDLWSRILGAILLSLSPLAH